MRLHLQRNRTGYWLPFPKFVFGAVGFPLGPWILVVDLSRR
ncbi:MAG: hypothetical protein ABR532_02545 [Candidatus Dormibacteria bacterium]